MPSSMYRTSFSFCLNSYSKYLEQLMKKTTVKRNTVGTYIKLKQKTSTKYFSLSLDLNLKLKIKISKKTAYVKFIERPR